MQHVATVSRQSASERLCAQPIPSGVPMRRSEPYYDPAPHMGPEEGSNLVQASSSTKVVEVSERISMR